MCPIASPAGKMLLYGALLRCLDPVLTIAAAQGWGRPIFWSPPDKRDEVRAVVLAFAQTLA
jgi:ATP-dependent RNA helicase DHX57